MGIHWPDYHRVQIPTIATNTFDCDYKCAFDSRTSIVSLVILTYKDFNKAWHKQYYSSIVHDICVLDKDSLILYTSLITSN